MVYVRTAEQKYWADWHVLDQIGLVAILFGRKRSCHIIQRVGIQQQYILLGHPALCFKRAYLRVTERR